MSRHRYTVRGFASAGHPAGYGTLLLSTWHTTESSKDMEVAAWMSRMKRGEVAYVEVLDHEKAKMERITSP